MHPKMWNSPPQTESLLQLSQSRLGMEAGKSESEPGSSDSTLFGFNPLLSPRPVPQDTRTNLEFWIRCPIDRG